MINSKITIPASPAKLECEIVKPFKLRLSGYCEWDSGDNKFTYYNGGTADFDPALVYTLKITNVTCDLASG